MTVQSDVRKLIGRLNNVDEIDVAINAITKAYDAKTNESKPGSQLSRQILDRINALIDIQHVDDALQNLHHIFQRKKASP
ncbi:MAG: hypothetical protein Q9218_003216 [Villophora microphyllina]